MKIIDTIPSRERCAESGWYAWDLLLEQPMDDAFIRALRPLGSFVYLTMLAKSLLQGGIDLLLHQGAQGRRVPSRGDP